MNRAGLARTVAMVVASLSIAAGCGSSAQPADPAHEVLVATDLGAGWVSDPGTPLEGNSSKCDLDALLPAVRRAQANLYYQDSVPSVRETVTAFSGSGSATQAFETADGYIDSCPAATENVAGRSYTIDISPTPPPSAHGDQVDAWHVGVVPLGSSVVNDVVLVRQADQDVLLIVAPMGNDASAYKVTLSAVLDEALKRLA